MKNPNLVNMKGMIELANKNKFAIPHININNLEWIVASLQAAIIAKSPIILGVSMGAAKYMGSYKVVFDMVNETMNSLNCDVPVCLHLDHGDYDSSIMALDAGFTSIMFDGSSLEFNENMTKSKQLVDLCLTKNASIEVEVGAIGGEEDGISNLGELANIDECVLISKLHIDMLAAGIGNVHGLYPKNWKGLNFDLLDEIVKKTNKPIVLHGGSGIDDESIRRAIKLGVRKINVNTECQIAFSKSIKKYFDTHLDILVDKNYDPRKYLKIGTQAIIDTCIQKMKLFNSYNSIK